jgi:hypothetical protein
MTRFVPALAFLLLFGAVAAEAQITKPIRYTWIATSCETWNCAAAELVLADGSPHVMALPTKDEARPWLILRRVEEGSIFIPEDEPFTCEVFDGVSSATTRFSALDACHSPIILNVPDGRAVVMSLQKCGNGTARRRAAGPR